MVLTESKKKIYQLVDSMDNEEQVELLYQFLVFSNRQKTGAFATLLSDEDTEELNQSFEESFDERNLLSNDDVKQKYALWFAK